MTRHSALLLLALLASSGCQSFVEGFKAATRPHALTDAKGTLQITVPASWTEDSLNKAAQLQASNRLAEVYVVVLSEAKEDLADMDLDKFSQITRGAQLKTMKNAIEKGPERRTIHQLPSVQYELRGTVDAANVVMLHAAVEGQNRFHQVLVWTLKSKWEDERATLQAVVDSLTELPAAPAPH